MFKVRKAKLSDATDVYNIWSRGWRYAYDGILSSAFLDNYVGDIKIKQNIESFSDKLREPGRVLLVLVDKDTVIGFVDGGSVGTPEYKCDVELDTMYLDTRYIGMGGGKLLFKAFFKEMKSRGFKTVGLWCFSDNKSMGFYQKMGGAILGCCDNKKFENIKTSYIKFDIDEVLNR